MPMSSATLSTQLQTLAPTGDEVTAVTRLAQAWQTYFSDAAAGAVPFVSTVPAAKAAMAAALVGMSVTGAVAIQAGVAAFWGALAASPTLYFPTATVVTPPPNLATIAAVLVPVFLANTVGSLSLQDACDAIAAVLHVANIGGSATLPGPVVTPIL